MSSHPQVRLDSQSRPHSLTGVVVQEDEVVSIDVWDYFVENIDEFAVAKSIVDYFDARPADLHNPRVDVDVFGLYIRAKVTLKRSAISYAETHQAIERAKVASCGLRPKIRAAGAICRQLRQALMANAEQAIVLATFGCWILAHLV